MNTKRIRTSKVKYWTINVIYLNKKILRINRGKTYTALSNNKKGEETRQEMREIEETNINPNAKRIEADIGAIAKTIIQPEETLNVEISNQEDTSKEDYKE